MSSPSGFSIVVFSLAAVLLIAAERAAVVVMLNQSKKQTTLIAHCSAARARRRPAQKQKRLVYLAWVFSQAHPKGMGCYTSFFFYRLTFPSATTTSPLPPPQSQQPREHTRARSLRRFYRAKATPTKQRAIRAWCASSRVSE